MVMLSRLRTFDLVDAGGRRASRPDFRIGMADVDYPPVTDLIFRNEEGQEQEVPVENLERIDTAKRQLVIKDLSAARPTEKAESETEVLLDRDVKDAMVLDLQNRRAVRANDLWLEYEEGELKLKAADIGIAGILRRISRGRLGWIRKGELYDWKYVEFLTGDPTTARPEAGHHLRIARLPPGEIATLCAYLPYLHAAEMVTILPDQIATDTLEAMPIERQVQVLEELSQERAETILSRMAPDLAADLVGRLLPDDARRYLENMDNRKREKVLQLLQYDSAEVGGIMTNEFVCAPAGLTASEALDHVRPQLNYPDFADLIYVVNNEKERRLEGVVSLRRLLLTEGETNIREVMDPYVVFFSPHESAREAAYRLVNAHLVAIPVIDKEGSLIGAVTIDAALGQIAPLSWSAQAPRVFS